MNRDETFLDLIARGVPWWLAREAISTTAMESGPPGLDDLPDRD